MNEQNEGYVRTCCRCKCEFESMNKRAYICPYCKKENKRISMTQRNDNFKKPKVVAHYRPAADVGIIRMARIIDRYNAEHGTHYSYGKFVQLVEAKKINFSKVMQDARLPAQKE